MDNEYFKYLSEYYDMSYEEVETFFIKLGSDDYDSSFAPKLLDKTLSDFYENINIANTKFGSERQSFISRRRILLYRFLNDKITTNPLSLVHINNKRDQIQDQHNYWTNELKRLPEDDNRLRKLDIEFKKREIIRMFKHVNSNLHKLDGCNVYTLGEVNKEELNDAKDIFQNIKGELEPNIVSEIKNAIISISQEIKNKTTSKDTLFIDKLLAFNTSLSQDKKDMDNDKNAVSCKIEYIANYFNEISYHFFAYLIIHYVNEEEIHKNARGVKRKLSYTWHFMKECDKYEKDFSFTMTKKEFKKIIWKYYGSELKNMDKEDSYLNSHHHLLSRHLRSFRDK